MQLSHFRRHLQWEKAGAPSRSVQVWTLESLITVAAGSELEVSECRSRVEGLLVFAAPSRIVFRTHGTMLLRKFALEKEAWRQGGMVSRCGVSLGRGVGVMRGGMGVCYPLPSYRETGVLSIQKKKKLPANFYWTQRNSTRIWIRWCGLAITQPECLSLQSSGIREKPFHCIENNTDNTQQLALMAGMKNLRLPTI